MAGERVLVLCEDDDSSVGWYAQGMDKDIGAQGRTREEALSWYKVAAAWVKEDGDWDRVPDTPERVLNDLRKKGAEEAEI